MAKYNRQRFTNTTLLLSPVRQGVNTLAKKHRTDEENDEARENGMITPKQAQAAFGVIKNPKEKNDFIAKEVNVGGSSITRARAMIEADIEAKLTPEQIANKYSTPKWELIADDVKNYIDVKHPPPPPEKLQKATTITATDTGPKPPIYTSPEEGIKMEGEVGLLRYVLGNSIGMSDKTREMVINYFKAHGVEIKQNPSILLEMMKVNMSQERASWVQAEFFRLIKAQSLGNASPSSSITNLVQDPDKPTWMTDAQWYNIQYQEYVDAKEAKKEEERRRKEKEERELEERRLKLEKEEERRIRKEERQDEREERAEERRLERELRHEEYLERNAANQSKGNSVETLLPLFGYIVKRGEKGEVTYEYTENGKKYELPESMVKHMMKANGEDGGNGSGMFKAVAEVATAISNASKPAMDVLVTALTKSMGGDGKDERKEMVDLIKTQYNPFEFLKNMKAMFPNAFGAQTENFEGIKLKMEQEWKMFENKVDLKKWLVEREERVIDKTTQMENMKNYMNVFGKAIGDVLGPLAKYIGAGYLYEKSGGHMTAPDSSPQAGATGSQNTARKQFSEMTNEELEAALKDRDTQAANLNKVVSIFNATSGQLDLELQRRRSGQGSNKPAAQNSTQQTNSKEISPGVYIRDPGGAEPAPKQKDELDVLD